ncbi:hypothetical protein KSF73_02580 [Burkholderiaceae bacterium DAT-1]|nr:hypothetical protein [Burkholderiaceae bacterium DAT-1]
MDISAEQIQVRRLARLLRWLVMLALAGGTLVWGLFSWTLWAGQTQLQGAMAGGVATIGVGMAQTGGLVGHPPLMWLYMSLDLAIVGYGLLRLSALLLGYEAGDLFSRRAADHLSAFALCMVLREAVDMVVPLVGGLAGFSIDSGSLRLLLVGTVFWLLSRILAAAYTIADDHGRII